MSDISADEARRLLYADKLAFDHQRRVEKAREWFQVGEGRQFQTDARVQGARLMQTPWGLMKLDDLR